MRDRSDTMRGSHRPRLRLARRLAGVRERCRGQEGQTLVEFALAAPLLILILGSIVNFGIMLNQYVTVSDAARSGARELALEQGNNDPCDPAVVTALSTGSSIGLTATNVSISFASATGVTPVPDYCVSSGGKATTYTYPANNSSASATNPGAEVEGDTATVTVQKVYRPSVFGFQFFSVNLSSSSSDAIE